MKKMSCRAVLKTAAAVFLAAAVFAAPAFGVKADPADGENAVPSVAVTDVSGNSTLFDVAVSGYDVPDGAYLEAAVWSEANDQDDIIWYKMSASDDGTYHVSVDPKDHADAGTYNAHVYCNVNGERGFVGGVPFSVDGGSCGGITVEDVDSASGTCTVMISGVSCAPGVSLIQAPVWSKEDQSDIVWYEASLGSDGNYYAYVDVANHSYNSGSYNVHSYITSSNGHMTFLGKTTVDFNESRASAVTVSASGGNSFALHAEGFRVFGGVSKAYFVVWSEANGQDDISWNEAPCDLSAGTIDLVYNASGLKDSGVINVHVYIERNTGELQFLGKTTFDYQADTGGDRENWLTETYDAAAGTFSVKVDGSCLDPDIKSVVVPVWSREDQSDIVWYETAKDASGNYTASSSVAKHNYNTGKYYVHAYGINSKGEYVFLEGDEISFDIVKGEISCSTGNGLSYDISYSGLTVPAGEKNVLIAVWSEANGQDDIVWYEASGTDGSYGVSVDIRDHGDMSGVYNAHAYATLKNGELVFIGKTAFEIEGSADGQITVSDTDAGNGIFTVSVQLSNIKGSVGNVRVPVWTRADQSDIYWYNAVNSGNGLYTATVDIRNHDNNTGLFYIHAYAVFSNRAEVFLTGVEHSFSTEAGLMVSNPDGSGTRRITYTNPSVSSVRFAVWTEENGQDDIRWYTANPAGNGAFYYDVSSADHKGNGKYIVHVYSGDTMLGNTSFGIVDYAEWAVRMSLDDSIGYSQDYRCLNPDVDCSSFIYYALYYNGFSGSLTSYPFYTGSQITYMERCGFEVMDFTSEENLQPGDVLWYRSGSMGHTEIYLGDGLMVGAHDSVVNGIDYSEGGDQTGQEVSVKAFSDPGWTKVLRIYG